MMTRARGISLATSAVVAELVAALALAGGTSTGAIALALALHAVSVMLVVRLLDGVAHSLGLAPVTPVALVAALFLPLVGPLGVSLLLRSVAKGVRGAVAGPPPVITRAPELPAAAPEAPVPVAHAVTALAAGTNGANGTNGTHGSNGTGGAAPDASAAFSSLPHLGPGALAARLRFARDSSTRVRTVLATRTLDGGRATPLLRQALRDGHEDVRLLAYALLEDRERAGDAVIRNLLAALAAASEERKPAVNEQLAYAYWELCYQGLVAGELQAFALARTLQHLDAAAAASPARAGARWLLRARVLLRQGQAGPARAALEESRRCGMPARTVDPYLVETFFIERVSARGTTA